MCISCLQAACQYMTGCHMQDCEHTEYRSCETTCSSSSELLNVSIVIWDQPTAVHKQPLTICRIPGLFIVSECVDSCPDFMPCVGGIGVFRVLVCKP